MSQKTSIMGQLLQRFDFFVTRFQQVRAPQENKVITYRVPENSQEQRPIPLFGADSSGFGEDWASHRIAKPQPFGSQKIEHIENTHGHVAYDSPAPMPTERPYEDPMISPHPSRSSENTDQRPVGLGHSQTPGDKEIVLHNESRKSFLSSKSKGEPTPGDLAAQDLKHYSYDFGY